MKRQRARKKLKAAGAVDRQLFPDPPDLPGRKEKIYPRNLTALAAYLVPGNPAVTRPEDAVANCFPGLEMDVRNLDRRFFPGLVFEFVRDGARVAYVDALSDPDLQFNNPQTQLFYQAYKIDEKTAKNLFDRITDGTLDEGKWYLDWIEQSKNNKKYGLSVKAPPDQVDDGNAQSIAWRLVRSLEPGPLKMRLKRKDKRGTMVLNGWRRQYTDLFTGVLSGAFQPGELMQGLCSPWQHDFRDCQCFYWAANHPDAVLGELYPGEATSPGAVGDGNQHSAGQAAPPPGERILKSVPLDWIRSNRARTMDAEARGTIAENRPYQMDAYEINRRWQDLSVVVEGREIGNLYIPQADIAANPFDSSKDLNDKLKNYLAPLELALTFEYLYALFSLRDSKKVKGDELKGAVQLARDRLLLITMSEMQHLRWVNEIIWNLPTDEREGPFKPVLEIPEDLRMPMSPLTPPSKLRENNKNKKEDMVDQQVVEFIRTGRQVEVEPGTVDEKPTRAPQLRPLTEDVIEDFIAVEHPSGLVDGAYARVIATFNQASFKPRLPRHLVELPMRIAGDGVQHEIRFLELKQALLPFDEDEYLHKVSENAAEAEAALPLLRIIKEGLFQAYHFAGNKAPEVSGGFIKDARDAMTKLFVVGEHLASKGVGIPFFKYWNSIK
jgi:hypothetical protein